MHIYFSGIGGAAIGPLALIAKAAGYTVSGSDKQKSNYTDYLNQQGIINIHIGQDYEQIAAVHSKQPIDWFVYTSALPIEHPDAPELRFCKDQGIKATKRDDFLSTLLTDKQQKLIAIAGTHGKTTTTAMLIWLFKQLQIPVSYSVGAKLSFGEMGEYNPASEFFVYEADEYDRNFLAFHPYLALITGVDWDHPDIYPSQQDYDAAFRQFLAQSQSALLWKVDAAKLKMMDSEQRFYIINETDKAIDDQLSLAGHVNRLNAWQVAHAVHAITSKPLNDLLEIIANFPGVARRFEQLAPQIYSDYAHTPPKIRGALQLAHEIAGSNVVVIYEGLHNTRQHFIQQELHDLFNNIKQLYIVPSYLAREDPNLPLLTPEDLKQLLSPVAQQHTEATALNKHLEKTIQQHVSNGDTVIALSAGGGGSLDEWLRTHLANAG